MTDPRERRLAIIKLHAEGWTPTSIAGYLGLHHIEGEDKIYCISILENYARAILASAISRRQDTAAYLSVLYAAIRKHGCPEAIVSDHGGVFLSHEAASIYTSFGIRKEE